MKLSERTLRIPIRAVPASLACFLSSDFCHFTEHEVHLRFSNLLLLVHSPPKLKQFKMPCTSKRNISIFEMEKIRTWLLALPRYEVLRLFAITRNRTCDTIWTERGEGGGARLTTHITHLAAPVLQLLREEGASFTPVFSPKTRSANT